MRINNVSLFVGHYKLIVRPWKLIIRHKTDGSSKKIHFDNNTKKTFLLYVILTFSVLKYLNKILSLISTFLSNYSGI